MTLKQSAEAAAEEYVVDGDCEVMDTYMAHTATYLAGSAFLAKAVLGREELKQVREALRCNAINPKRADIMAQSEQALAALDKLLSELREVGG